MSDSLHIVQELLAAFGSRDPDIVMRFFAPEPTVVYPMNIDGSTDPQLVFTGTEQVAGFVNLLVTHFSHVGITDPVWTVSDDGRVVFVQGTSDMVLSGGTPYRNVVVFKFELTDEGLVRRMTEYANPVTMATLNLG
ncbi:hypothetical protein Val02_14530 [Virgisporangium aliadipatigenens]|uniref:SnoaL-like domain-containing protein n=1 Tax=Virgisporangium aliadipatigenens TaxID=741659 RepID=A0A8J3YHK1_9ACTN|nr:nuclear transport factor 2 family protein [Virgisporangium aliadipatigenens]GIJ44567.1 hypothetical protein Val02_14530 [Virgisporangium aliadipatigenens]